MLGDGSSSAGSRLLQRMIEEVRNLKTGSTDQAASLLGGMEQE
jgi:hypothetical protein